MVSLREAHDADEGGTPWPPQKWSPRDAARVFLASISAYFERRPQEVGSLSFDKVRGGWLGAWVGGCARALQPRARHTVRACVRARCVRAWLRAAHTKTCAHALAHSVCHPRMGSTGVPPRAPVPSKRALAQRMHG